MRRSLVIPALIAAALLIALGAVVVSTFATSSQPRYASTALDAAHQQMVWYSGPTVQTVRVSPLRRLGAILNSIAPANLRSDVNVDDLIRRFGPNRQVAAVILRGVYNSLPPDEGVTVHGDIVVVVDAHSNRVLLLTD